MKLQMPVVRSNPRDENPLFSSLFKNRIFTTIVTRKLFFKIIKLMNLVSGKYQNTEKPLKRQRRLGLPVIYKSYGYHFRRSVAFKTAQSSLLRKDPMGTPQPCLTSRKLRAKRSFNIYQTAGILPQQVRTFIFHMFRKIVHLFEPWWVRMDEGRLMEVYARGDLCGHTTIWLLLR